MSNKDMASSDGNRSMKPHAAVHPSLHQTDSRRHSSRSIKRRKFDDEIVESSLAMKGIRKHEDNHENAGSPDIDEAVTSPLGPNLTADSQLPSQDMRATLPSTERKGNVSSKKRPTSQPKKKVKKMRQAFAAVKDMGRWKPTDDVLLIDAVEQLYGLNSVHLAVKFSCQFTLEEIRERWYALLYDPVISSLAKQAMKSHPQELVEAAHAKAPFSEAEEALLSCIPSDSSSTIEKMTEILNENPDVFWKTRTPQSLLNHWTLLLQYRLLDDQRIQPLTERNQVMTFSDADDMLDDTVLCGPSDKILAEELALNDRRQKREIKQLEEENERWRVLVSSVGESRQPSQFDEKTVAVLQGRLVRYLMRSKEITLGRNTDEFSVDVNLSLEGPAMKISRKQGMIKLKKNGEFILSNTGKRFVLVDGKPVSNGSKMRLTNNSVVEIALLKFVFLINQDLVDSFSATREG